MKAIKLHPVTGLLAFCLLFTPQFSPKSLLKDNSQNVLGDRANPLVQVWGGPYAGVPPFDKVQVSDFKPALESAMAENLQEIEKITSDIKSPNFENTIAALERSGRTLGRVSAIYNLWSGSMSSKEFQEVEGEMALRLAAFYDQISQNKKLFERIEWVYNSPEKVSLTPEQQRLAWIYYTNFVRSGARLDDTKKARLTEINQKLATLFTQFSQNLLADESLFMTLEKESDLAGLPQSLKDAAATAASRKNVTGKWVIANTRSSIDPFLTYSSNRSLREKAWRMFKSRGDNGDKTDNNAIITNILQLRAERAKLLGYTTHAHMILDDRMAKTPEQAMQLMETVWKPAVARVKEEVADMQAIADKEKANIKIEAWDYLYYAEKVRKAKFDIDENEVKQYLQLEKMREAMFWMAGEIFDFTFTPASNVPVFHPDVRVWEVKNKTTGKHVGLWYFDPFAREGKRSGAWMNAYRAQERLDKEIPTIVSNNANFIKGKPGEPLLISWDDASTLFHEFGHALHGLSSDVTYPTLASPNVTTDYVEFPSQLLENWLPTKEILQRFALHYKTGKPIPQALVDKINKTSTFNEGYTTATYLSSALIDMKLHLSKEAVIDPDKFERETLVQLGTPSEIVMRHRTPQFGHIFSSDGYSAGYYSYLWSDVITSDAFEAFTEAGGPYDKTVGAKMRKYIFSVGNTIDPAEAYRSFRGRDPRIDALLRKRGFVEK